MKKTILSILLLSAIFSVKAQEAMNAIKINPISAILRTGSIFYERKLNDGISAQLGLSISGLKLDNVKYQGFSITPEVRFYMKKRAISGLYVAPYLRYQNYQLSADDKKGTLSSIGGGALVGRQWVFGSGFALDLFLGPSYNNGTYKNESGSKPNINSFLEGFGIRTGVALGFGF